MTDQPADPQAPYRVLARKYRPQTFVDLIGQDALVRTLTNALESDRVAHAYLFTGVRGVGKTTTARILARALNCVGPDGNGSVTPRPCGECEHCVAIAQDRHVDVLEMDAASRTGVADMRELIDGVRYRPVRARTKVYIIDEVHMLSTSAFNALLKTLEEPPEHVVFVFATTEIRKVPVTVLSRCQRFDLHRVDRQVLMEHFRTLLGRENVGATDEAIAMIARAADGSVRDGLSLIDQATALSGGADVSTELVRDMLGLADRGRVFDLFEALVRGEASSALELLDGLHDAGADPGVVIQDLLEIAHFLTRAKLAPAVLEDAAVPELERRLGRKLVDRLSVAELSRLWQLLLKGHGEVQQAPQPLQAAEMIVVRITHASRLPVPAELVSRLSERRRDPAPAASSPAGNASGGGGDARSSRQVSSGRGEPSGDGPRAQLAARIEPLEEPEPDTPPAPAEETSEGMPPVSSRAPASFREVVDMAREAHEMRLASHLRNDVRLVRFEHGRIELCPGEHAPGSLAGDLARFLQRMSEERWIVSLAREGGAPTLREQEHAEERQRREEVMRHPFVRAALETFPGARLIAHRRLDTSTSEPAGESPDQGLDSDGDDEE